MASSPEYFLIDNFSLNFLIFALVSDKLKLLLSE